MFRDKIKIQTQKLHLIPAQDVLDGLDQDAANIQARIAHLKTIDITNVKPMVRIDETPITFLREDEPHLTHELVAQKSLLDNAPLTSRGFIAIRKADQND